MESAISVTEAARNFAEVVNRAYYRHETTTLLKNGKPVARIVPAGTSMRTGKEIAAEMTSNRPRLGAEEAGMGHGVSSIFSLTIPRQGEVFRGLSVLQLAAIHDSPG